MAGNAHDVPEQLDSSHIVEPEEHAGVVDTLLGWPLRRWDTVAIILLTAVADICLYSHPGGTGGAVLLLAAAVGLLSLSPAGVRSGNPLLLLGILAIAVGGAWNPSWWLLWSVGVLTVLAFVLKLHRPDYRITELFWAGAWTVMCAPFRLTGHGLRCLGFGRVFKAAAGQRRRVRLRVIVIPIIVTGLFLLIFVAAHPVVEKLVQDLTDWLGEWVSDFFALFTVWRIITWVLWLLAFAALVRPAVKSWVADWLARREEDLTPPERERPDKGNYAAALATLVCVNVLFLAFNALDAVYLYFNAELPRDVSYSTFSHRGCIWLTVALGMSSVVIGIAFRRRLNFHAGSARLRSLAYLWAALNAILAIGALRRLQMYVDYNGLTRLRVVGLYGILLVCVGLGLMVWKVRRSKNFVWLLRCDLAAFWIALIVLAVTPRDYVCWRYNVGQAMRGNLRPLANLIVQPMSAESLPPLIRLLDHSDPVVQKGAAALLRRKLDELRAAPVAGWTEWDGSRVWAVRRLEAVEPRLAPSAPEKLEAIEWRLAPADPEKRYPDENALLKRAEQWL